MSTKDFLKDIINMVTHSSSFRLDEQTDSHLLFSTREHGDVGSEEYSQLDVQEAQRVVKLIKSKYDMLGYEYEIEPVDEWVLIHIRPPETVIPIYHFMKHQSRHWRRFAAGFSKGFRSMEELVERYGDWSEVKDVDLIKVMKETEVADKTPYPFGKFNKIVQVYDAGDENKYSYSIGFSFVRGDSKF